MARQDSETRGPSPKEALQGRARQQQLRQIKIVLYGILGLFAVVLIFGVVNELLLKPSLPVAVVHDEEISLRQFKKEVTFQRAQLIFSLESLETAVGGDIALVQQYGGQQINTLLDTNYLGQVALDNLIEDRLVRTEAEARGITVSDDDIDAELALGFNYYEGDLPTPMPTATSAPDPTPTITPLFTEPVTETVPSTPTATAEPVSTLEPLPTATRVSLESYDESRMGLLSDFRKLGVSEETYRRQVANDLYRRRLTEAMAAEAQAADKVEKASFRYVAFETEEAAHAAFEEMPTDGFLGVWNRIKSTAIEEGEPPIGVASEVLWRVREEMDSIFGLDIGQRAFELPVGDHSEVFAAASGSQDERFYVLEVTGREVQKMSKRELQIRDDKLLDEWLAERRYDDVEEFDRWRSNIPKTPRLDSRFLAQQAAQP